MNWILVSGAGGGMGRAFVRIMAEQGYTVFALDRTPCRAQENVIPLTADVTDEQSLQAAARIVCGYTKRLFAIVHFAGLYRMDSLIEMESAAFSEIFSVNLCGAAALNRVFFPFLSAGSRILITTSELAPLLPLPFTGIYAASKAALDRYAYALRMELQLRGISVSVLRAGAVKTDMLGASVSQLERFCAKTELYRCNAARFRSIVNHVEAKHIPPEKLARFAAKILRKKRPCFAYAINRNPLLLLFSVLPSRLQFFLIRKILD